MTDIAEFPADFAIARRWPPQHPQRLQLYTQGTPNGHKVSIMLEECGLPYEAHRIDIGAGEQMMPEFLSLNPNNKIPAIIDPQGPQGRPLALFESGAILVYLADKTGMFLPAQGTGRYQTLQWLMWQMGGAGPMFGQLGFFLRYGGKDFEDKRPRDRYANETRRLLGVLDRHLQGRTWMLGDTYTIADMAIFPWVRCVRDVYQAVEMVGLGELQNVQRVLEAFLARPAVQKGLA
jgi:GST-like protein